MRVIPILAGEIRVRPKALLTPEAQIAGPATILRQLMQGTAHDWTLPVPVFLVEHPDRGRVLIDTGYALDAGTDPARTMGRTNGWLFENRPNDLLALLGEHGATDIGTILMTHLHTDHISGMGLFPGAEFVADRVEWAAGFARGGWMNGYHRPTIELATRRRELDFSGPDAAPLGPFKRTIDVFGDGSVIACSTPGHAVGHVSFVIGLGGGEELLLTGDAAYLRRQLDDLKPAGLIADRVAYATSLAAVAAYATRDGVSVITGHDADVWPTLPAAFGA
jgi:N-acyl homoserine lactone hydrolase